MKVSSNRTIAVVSAVLSAASLGLSFASVAWMFGNREQTKQNAELSLVREAGIVGERLDGIFRTAAVVLSGMARDPSDIAELALSVPEASNYLFVDDQGRVLGSFYRRTAPNFVASGALQRLKGGSRFEAGEAYASSDGSRSLILAQRVDSRDGGYAGAAVAVFSERVLDDAHSSLHGSLIELIYLSEVSDSVILFRSRTNLNPAEASDASFLRGSYQLRSLPLRVSVLADRAALLDPRNRVPVSVSVVAFAFFLVFGVMAVYAVSMVRGERRSMELSRELERREALFREVSHRVKNDLQIVKSILVLGMGHLEDGEGDALEVLKTAEARIHSISLVHEQLYKRAALATTDLGSYLEDLASFLEDAYAGGRPISVSSETEIGLVVPLEAAVPCGILINELVTNAFKYAFPEGLSGMIRIGGARRADGGIDLRVEDDGVGFSEGKNQNGASSFGLVLVRSLADQLKAALRREGGPGQGTRWIVSLPPETSIRSST